MLLCTNDEGAPTVGGEGSEECPDGEPFVRWEWNEDTGPFEAEEDDANTTMNATEFKDDDETEPVEAEWTSSTYNVTGVVVGAGGVTCTYSYSPDGTFPQAETVETCDEEAGGGVGGGGEAAALGMAAPVVSAILAVTKRFASLLPLYAGGGTVAPLALLLSGTVIGWRRGR